ARVVYAHKLAKAVIDAEVMDDEATVKAIASAILDDDTAKEAEPPVRLEKAAPAKRPSHIVNRSLAASEPRESETTPPPSYKSYKSLVLPPPPSSRGSSSSIHQRLPPPPKPPRFSTNTIAPRRRSDALTETKAPTIPVRPPAFPKPAPVKPAPVPQERPSAK